MDALFDCSGRRIPKGLLAKVCNVNRTFRLDQPKLDFANFAFRILRMHWCLGIDTEVFEQFKPETERLLAIIRGNSLIANIANGVCLPIVMPKIVNDDDIGKELELYLSGVKKSYIKTFGDRKFRHRKGTLLSDDVVIVDGSRYYELIAQMKEDPVIGIYFPNSLQGFSCKASREQMATLPEGFILSGMDIIVAMMMYPDILARGINTPGLHLAALEWPSVDSKLYFRAGNGELVFCSAGYLAYASGFYSGGLLFLG